MGFRTTEEVQNKLRFLSGKKLCVRKVLSQYHRKCVVQFSFPRYWGENDESSDLHLWHVSGGRGRGCLKEFRTTERGEGSFTGVQNHPLTQLELSEEDETYEVSMWSRTGLTSLCTYSVRFVRSTYVLYLIWTKHNVIRTFGPHRVRFVVVTYVFTYYVRFSPHTCPRIYYRCLTVWYLIWTKRTLSLRLVHIGYVL